MAGKLPNKNHKGRCQRCCLSFKGVPLKRPKHPIGNVCAGYRDYCQYVAWNCNVDSKNGIEISDLSDNGKKLVKEYIDECMTKALLEGSDE